MFGPSGLHIAPKNSEVAHFFSELGKLLLMFFAGLEIDLTQFQRVRNRSLAYGLASLGTPLVCGVALGQLFGYNWIASFLIGSVFASHTLLGYQAKNAAGARLIDEPILHSVLVLLVVTSVLGPVLTERFGKRMVAAEQRAAP